MGNLSSTNPSIMKKDGSKRKKSAVTQKRNWEKRHIESVQEKHKNSQNIVDNPYIDAKRTLVKNTDIPDFLRTGITPDNLFNGCIPKIATAIRQSWIDSGKVDRAAVNAAPLPEPRKLASARVLFDSVLGKQPTREKVFLRTPDKLDQMIPPSWLIKKENLVSSSNRRKLGEGTFGVVRLCHYMDPKNGGQQIDVAVKEICHRVTNRCEEKHEAFVDRVVRELTLLMVADTRYSVRGYGGYFQSSGQAEIIMEVMELGNLADYLQVYGEGMRNFHRVQLCLHCLRLLEYLQKGLKVVHGDASPTNLLVSRNGRVKLSDFGLCRSLTGTGDFIPTGSGTSRTWQRRYYHLNTKAGTADADLSVDQFSFCFIFLRILFGHRSPMFQHAQLHKSINVRTGVEILGDKARSFLNLVQTSLVTESVLDLQKLRRAMSEIDYGGNMNSFLTETKRSLELSEQDVFNYTGGVLN